MRGAARFFSFNKPTDWTAGIAANMSLSSDGATIGRTDQYAVYRTVHGSEIDGADGIADLAVGPGSKLYILDARASLLVHDYENRHTEPLYVAGHGLFSARALLAAEDDALYIADPAGERKVASVSPSNGQLLWAERQWDGLELFPLAAATDAGRSLYTVIPLDIRPDAQGGAGAPEGGRIAVLQWSLSGQVSRLYAHDSLRLKEAVRVDALRDRFALALAGEGEPVLIDAEGGKAIVFRSDGEVRETFAIGLERTGGFAIDSRRRLYLGEKGNGRSVEDELFIRAYSERGEPLAVVSGYRARADKLLHDGQGRMYALDAEKGAITLLELKARTKMLPDNGLPEARYISGELDSAENETEWHKVELLADIPEETQIRVSYFATDERFGVLDGRVVDYAEYFADPAIPFARKWEASRHLWSEPIVNPRDALFMSAKGRYLRFRLELAGGESSAPVIRRLRVFFPRQSPIRHLPPIYQEDPDGSGFLERFLAIFGTLLAEMEEKIDRVSANFDPDAVSGPYLKWLSGWLSLDIADGWDEEKLRTLMKRAPELYKQRGTRRGLAEMLRIYTGTEPFIVEFHQLKAMQESSELRQLFTRLYGDNPYCFCVMLPPECVRTDKQRLAIEAIIADQKPAYTEGRLIVLQPWMHADMHTYLGINTVLSEPTPLTLDKQSSMPHHTVLIDPDRDNRLDIHTRLELDSELE